MVVFEDELVGFWHLGELSFGAHELDEVELELESLDEPPLDELPDDPLDDPPDDPPPPLGGVRFASETAYWNSREF